MGNETRVFSCEVESPGTDTFGRTVPDAWRLMDAAWCSGAHGCAKGVRSVQGWTKGVRREVSMMARETLCRVFRRDTAGWRQAGGRGLEVAHNIARNWRQRSTTGDEKCTAAAGGGASGASCACGGVSLYHSGALGAEPPVAP
jgi:hypothetical protein